MEAEKMAKKDNFNTNDGEKRVAKRDNRSHIAESTNPIDEKILFERVSTIIENRKYRAAASVNYEATMMFWDIGQFINSVVLGKKRAEYGKKILTELSSKLVATYGKSFSERNIYRMMLFAERFPDEEILTQLASKLSWSHFTELISVKSYEARLYYANDAASLNYGRVELRRQISRKAFERREIANTGLTEQSAVPFNVFKDPYLLDIFGLKDNYLEADLEKAILTDIEAFLLEFGRGFSFIERQKRMIIGGEDVCLDLLFYNRILKRLVAVELKLGGFKAAYKGQMELYLNWLDRFERQDGEEAPIGIILCASANRKIVEFLNMDKAGIAVAEYWTELPPNFEQRVKEIFQEAHERFERRKSMPDDAPRQIEYFLDKKDDEEDW
jgi:predicted nuclease of restriction endonuclease-like (RecB) superfamily